jgi:hypothetical protein
MKVWLVEGPAGGGPWFDNPHDAAEFVYDESLIDPETNMRTKPVVILPADGGSWPVGRTAERGEWSIQAVRILRREYAREWAGW